MQRRYEPSDMGHEEMLEIANKFFSSTSVWGFNYFTDDEGETLDSIRKRLHKTIMESLNYFIVLS